MVDCPKAATLGLLALLVALPAPRAPAAEKAVAPPAAGLAGPLAELLALAPDPSTAAEAPETQLFEFGDPAAQLAAVNVATVDRRDASADVRLWSRATRWLALPSPMREHALNPEWRELFGFDLFQIDQSLVTGEPPNRNFFLRGRFDPAEMRTAPTASGYQPLAIERVEVLSLFAEPAIGLANDVSRLALSALNNMTVLPDGTVVFASSLAGIRAVLAVASGAAPSPIERPEVATLLGSITTPLASAIVTTGSWLGLGTFRSEAVILGEQAGEVIDQVAALGTVPPVALAPWGVTPGGPVPLPPANDDEPVAPPAMPPVEEPQAAVVIALLTTEAVAAGEAVDVIDARLGALSSLVTRTPFAEMFAEWRVAAVPDAPVVTVELTVAPGFSPRLWVDLLVRRDVPFVAWG